MEDKQTTTNSSSSSSSSSSRDNKQTLAFLREQHEPNVPAARTIVCVCMCVCVCMEINDAQRQPKKQW